MDEKKTHGYMMFLAGVIAGFAIAAGILVPVGLHFIGNTPQPTTPAQTVQAVPAPTPAVETVKPQITKAEYEQQEFQIADLTQRLNACNSALPYMQQRALQGAAEQRGRDLAEKNSWVTFLYDSSVTPPVTNISVLHGLFSIPLGGGQQQVVPRWVVQGRVKAAVIGESNQAQYSFVNALSKQPEGPYIAITPQQLAQEVQDEARAAMAQLGRSSP